MGEQWVQGRDAATVPLRVALIYVAVAGLWILLSDRLLDVVGFEGVALSRLQTLKGWGFVGVTGALLYHVVRRAVLALESSRQALAQSEARFRSMFENAPVSLWEEDFTALKAATDELASRGVADLGAYLDSHPAFVQDAARKIHIRDVNQATLDLYGAGSKEELMGALERVFTGESYPAFRGEVVAFAEGRRLFECEGVNRTLGGAQLNVLMRATVPPGDRGFENVIVSITDLTARKRVEEELRRSEERHRSLIHDVLDSSAVGIWILDPQFRVVWVNRAAETYFGLRREEVLGRPKETLIRVRIQALFEEPEAFAAKVIATYRDNSYMERFECHVVAGPGRQERWLAHWSQPIATGLYAGGRIEHYYDITERKRSEEERRGLERQVQQAQKLESLGVLAGGIAHDFNNLLTAILGNAELALGHLPGDAPARASLGRVEEAAVRAAELANQMLAYSGRGGFSEGPVDLDRIVEEMARLLEASVSKKVELELRLAGKLPTVYGDPAQLRQVVMNLITNASEALDSQTGTVTLSTGVMDARKAYLEAAVVGRDCPPGRYVFLEVADTGAGMDQETLGKIFDPFFTTKFTGRGLGLSVVLGIVRGHGGAIHVRTQRGNGTAFRVLLPCRGEPAVAARDPVVVLSESPSVPRTGGTVLLVDDDEEVRRVGEAMLRTAGYRVVTAVDGADGVRQFLEAPGTIDAVLLDLTMPRLGGEETLAELRRARPDVPVVIVSGYPELESAERLRGWARVVVLQKPFRAARLLGALALLLNGGTHAADGKAQEPS